MLAGGGSHEQAQTGPSFFGLPCIQDGQGVADVGATPTRASCRHLEIAPRGGLAAFDADAAGQHVQTTPCLVLGQDTRDVVVHHHHLVAQAQPLTRKHADRCRATTHAHTLLSHTVNDRRTTGLQHHLGTVFNLHLGGLVVAQGVHEFQGHAALFFTPTGEVVHTTQAEHLRAVFGGGHMAHLFALVKHRSPLIAQIPVGVDLHLQTAIAKDALGHHSHHVHALGLGSDDERRRFVIGVGGGRANAGDKNTPLCTPQGGQALGRRFLIRPSLQSKWLCSLRGLA